MEWNTLFASIIEAKEKFQEAKHQLKVAENAEQLAKVDDEHNLAYIKAAKRQLKVASDLLEVPRKAITDLVIAGVEERALAITDLPNSCIVHVAAFLQWGRIQAHALFVFPTRIRCLSTQLYLALLGPELLQDACIMEVKVPTLPILDPPLAAEKMQPQQQQQDSEPTQDFAVFLQRLEEQEDEFWMGPASNGTTLVERKDQGQGIYKMMEDYFEKETKAE